MTQNVGMKFGGTTLAANSSLSECMQMPVTFPNNSCHVVAGWKNCTYFIRHFLNLEEKFKYKVLVNIFMNKC